MSLWCWIWGQGLGGGRGRCSEYKEAWEPGPGCSRRLGVGRRQALGHLEFGLGCGSRHSLSCVPGGTQSRVDMANPTKQLGRLHCVPWGKDTADQPLSSLCWSPQENPSFLGTGSHYLSPGKRNGGECGVGVGAVAQAVLELAGRVELIWMESLLCHLPSAHSHGRPGGQPGPRPTLQATIPGACHTQGGLTTDVGSKVRKEFPFAGGGPLAGSSEGTGIPELPVTSQPFSGSHPPRWPAQSRPPHPHRPGSHCCQTGSFLNSQSE